MQLRYQYRLAPTVGQRQALARAFGCARVVYNDALRLREDTHMAGRPFKSDGEVLRLVTTLAKRTPERAWLAEVSAVVLQQSVADLHRAYRNYFRALTEVKAERVKGNPQAKLRTRKPRLKSKRGEQAVRFTANSRFRILANGRLSLPKVGDVAVRWSRPLPAPPSSVTVTLDHSGRYHASFVVVVARIDRRYPSSQLCSACSTRTGPRGRVGLKVRTWICSACMASHDRDVNAARNILAAGRAVTACGGYVRPGHALAMAATPSGTEAGTTSGAAA